MSSRYRVELNWQYMACLTDGEGHIYVPPNREGVQQQVRITWAQAEHNAHWFDHVVAFLSSEGIKFSDAMYVASTGHPYRQVAVSGQASVEKCLRSMTTPYLILKEPQACEGLAVLQRQALARRTRRKSCARGHVRTDKNTYVNLNGKIVCRTCSAEDQRGYRRKTA